MKLSKFKEVKKVEVKDEPAAQWVITKLRQGAAAVNVLNNQLKVGWPTISQIVYPGQTARINTGLSSTQIGQDMQMMTLPQKGMLNAGLMSFAQVIDGDDPRQGGQIVQIVQNTNQFPVRLQYRPASLETQWQQIGPRIVRLNSETLQQQQQILFDLGDFDWGGLLSGIASVAIKVLPLLL